MSRSQNVSFEEVAAAIESLVAGGERPTMRRIHQKLGRGSMRTLSAFAQEYFASARYLMTLHRGEFSDEFYGAVVAEVKRILSKRSQELELQLDTAHENVENLEQDIEKLEGELKICKAEGVATTVKMSRETHDSEIRQARLEERLAVATSKIQGLETEKKDLTEKVKKRTSDLLLAEQKVAGAIEIRARLEDEIATLRLTNKELLEKILATGKPVSQHAPTNNKSTAPDKGGKSS